MSEIIRVRPTHDGTYTVYRGNFALISGLTRLQAERYEASIGRGPTTLTPAAAAS